MEFSRNAPVIELQISELDERVVLFSRIDSDPPGLLDSVGKV